MRKNVMDCKYLGIGRLDDKTPCWICKMEFVGRGEGEIIRDRPVMEFVCNNCHWYEKDDELKPNSSGGEECQENLL